MLLKEFKRYLKELVNIFFERYFGREVWVVDLYLTIGFDVGMFLVVIENFDLVWFK